MRTIIVLLILALLLAVCGLAVAASSPADLIRPQLTKIARAAGQTTGWHCRPVIVDNPALLIGAVVCEK